MSVLLQCTLLVLLMCEILFDYVKLSCCVLRCFFLSATRRLKFGQNMNHDVAPCLSHSSLHA